MVFLNIVINIMSMIFVIEISEYLISIIEDSLDDIKCGEPVMEIIGGK